ncbi:hypothetical protein [Actinoplanes siamensis]|uniref:Uncharacterized protein n=1 Tax=Actinoplanes siamensis TaxID=1223317 RepID=A0A919N595_9ACTN|nr:hypothetical protein [Actinoplanes siamensis]GIF04693.1 hypothetical protein Asi03nite_22310 [Actinoplanes siamensis]
MTTSAPRLDRRLVTGGMNLTITDLVAIWADHTPKQLPVPLTCPACGHQYSRTAPLCPSAAVTRPLLRRRRYGNPAALDVLTDNQLQDLTGKRLSTSLPEEYSR